MKATDATDDTPLVLIETEKGRVIAHDEEPNLEEATADRKKFVQLFGHLYPFGVEKLIVDSCRQAPVALPPKIFIVVFDLNGIYCHCTPRQRDTVDVPTWVMHDKAPDKLPALAGPKVVLPRRGYKVFWYRMSTMFHLCIWSSMKKLIVDLVVAYLFDRWPKPALVLGQEDCTT